MRRFDQFGEHSEGQYVLYADALERERVLREALEKVQYANGGFCPMCTFGQKKGHHKNCVIGAALAQ